jgi:hypothetical protein
MTRTTKLKASVAARRSEFQEDATSAVVNKMQKESFESQPGLGNIHWA